MRQDLSRWQLVTQLCSQRLLAQNEQFMLDDDTILYGTCSDCKENNDWKGGQTMTKKISFYDGLAGRSAGLCYAVLCLISQRNPTMTVLAWTAPSAIRSTSENLLKHCVTELHCSYYVTTILYSVRIIPPVQRLPAHLCWFLSGQTFKLK